MLFRAPVCRARPPNRPYAPSVAYHIYFHTPLPLEDPDAHCASICLDSEKAEGRNPLKKWSAARPIDMQRDLGHAERTFGATPHLLAHTIHNVRTLLLVREMFFLIYIRARSRYQQCKSNL